MTKLEWETLTGILTTKIHATAISSPYRIAKAYEAIVTAKAMPEVTEEVMMTDIIVSVMTVIAGIHIQATKVRKKNRLQDIKMIRKGRRARTN